MVLPFHLLVKQYHEDSTYSSYSLGDPNLDRDYAFTLERRLQIIIEEDRLDGEWFKANSESVRHVFMRSSCLGKMPQLTCKILR